MKSIINIVVAISILAIAITLVIIAGDTLQKYVQLSTIIFWSKKISYWLVLFASTFLSCKSYASYHRGIIFEHLVELGAVTPKMQMFGEIDSLTQIKLKNNVNFAIMVSTFILTIVLLLNF